MRIGVNTLSVTPGRTGGGETYLSSLTRAMTASLDRRESLHLFVSSRNEDFFREAAPGARFHRVPAAGRTPLRLAAEHLLLPALLHSRGIDVLLSPGNALPPLAGVRHVLALQSMHYRVVGHQMSPLRVAYFRRMVPLAAARAARVICMSASLRGELLQVAPRCREKAVVVHEGADLERFSPGEGGDGDYLLYVSSLNPFKRPDRAVEALASLRREGFEPPVLRMVGRPDPADRARVVASARDLNVADLVRIEGVVPNDALPDLYRGAAALVYPSAVETFGLPPLEAMACGTPVVASNRTSVPEVVGDAALIVDPDDVPALAAAIRRVLSDSALRAGLRERGFRNVRRFDWGRTAEQTLAVLRKAVGEMV